MPRKSYHELNTSRSSVVCRTNGGTGCSFRSFRFRGMALEPSDPQSSEVYATAAPPAIEEAKPQNALQRAAHSGSIQNRPNLR